MPILETSGLRAGEDFHLAFAPERVDPGRTDWTTKTTPKVVGGITPACAQRAAELYGRAVDDVHVVSTPEAAELTKLLENTFRAVNIALVNELAVLCDRMGIDIWEVVEVPREVPTPVAEPRLPDAQSLGHNLNTFSAAVPFAPVALRRSTTSWASSTRAS